MVDEALPHPVDSGKRIRTCELLRRLAKDHEIHLAFHQEGSVPAGSREYFEDSLISLFPVSRKAPRKRGPGFAWDLFRNLFVDVPYMVMAHRSGALRDAIREATVALRPDLVHVEWTPLVANVAGDIGPPVVLSAHNVETQIWERYLENEGSTARRAYISIQLSKLRRFETAALKAARAVIAVSGPDAARIREMSGNERVTVVPNGVDTAGFAPRPGTEPGNVLFIGSLDWRPNQDGLVWFLDEIWPTVKKLEPEARFVVVGRNPPDWLVARCGDVELHASVPEVQPFLAKAAVCVVPLRIGGGSRLKIPEALAMEKAVVSTSVGAEGLDLDGTVALRDEPGAFAEAVAAAARAPGPNRAGRELVQKRYDWDRLAPLLGQAWSTATDA